MALNLVQHRGQPNVWDRAARQPDWDTERWLAATAASFCFIAGMRRRSTAGLLLMLGGSSLAWWAAAGADERSQWRGQVRSAFPHTRVGPDVVFEASEESFPASDAPSWTSMTGNTSTCAGDVTTSHR